MSDFFYAGHSDGHGLSDSWDHQAGSTPATNRRQHKSRRRSSSRPRLAAAKCPLVHHCPGVHLPARDCNPIQCSTVSSTRSLTQTTRRYAKAMRESTASLRTPSPFSLPLSSMLLRLVYSNVAPSQKPRAPCRIPIHCGAVSRLGCRSQKSKLTLPPAHFMEQTLRVSHGISCILRVFVVIA